MGTQVHEKVFLPGYYSMRDLNEDSSSSNWPLFYGDRTLANGQYCNGFVVRTIMENYPGYNKDALKQKMLEHEAIFKNQVSELHRLYRIQRDMMEEVRKKELNKNRMSLEPSSSSSIRGSQVPYEDAQKWHTAGFPLSNSSTEITNSLLSCTQGNDVQSGRVHLQNGCSPRNCEVSEARPSKVRKKLFDLQFSADQYISTEEGKQLRDSKESFYPSYPANGNFTIGGGEKTDCRKDALVSHLSLRSVNGLADLNEPAQLEEATIPQPVDFLGHRSNYKEAETSNVTFKPNPGFLAPSEMMWNTNGRTSNGPLSSPFTESKGKERDWLSYTYEAGRVKSNAGPLPQCLEHNKLLVPFHPAEVRLGKAHQNPGIHQTRSTRDDLWRERAGCGLETTFGKSHGNSNYSRLEPVATPHHLVNSSEFSNSWSCSVSTSGRPTSGLTQKLTSFHTSSSLNSSMGVSRNSQPYGFYNGSSSGFREPSPLFPSAGFNNLHDSKGYNVSSGCSTNHRHEKLIVGSDFNGSKLAKDFDLNVTDRKQDEELVDDKRKIEETVPIFPWLKPKPVQQNEEKVRKSDSAFIQPSLISQNLNEILSQNAASTLSEHDITGTRNVRKILGVPIIENHCASKNESSVSTSATDGRHIRNDKKNIMIDINVAFDVSIADSEDEAAPDLHAGDRVDSKTTGIRNHFDLNSCFTEDEDPIVPSVVSNNVKARVLLEIDLEAPVVLDDEGDNPPEEARKQQDEAEQSRIAAESIVVISSFGQCSHIDETCPEDPLAESLRWFVDAVSSSKEVMRKDENCCSEDLDDFEAMTLRLEETKEEDFMPKPFGPEIQETAVGSVSNRTRKGQARRGRQRRDFQRDILPGLVSLSRHEVSEDLQTFGGLMRATGHVWSSGLTRRNGTRNVGGRGRRRAVPIDSEPAIVPTTTSLMHQLNNIESGLEDRSLTGWGKTPRRPRRQRCPAGNPSAAIPSS